MGANGDRASWIMKITANHMKNWVETRARDCQERMPELVRRLVRAHARKPPALIFRQVTAS